MPLRDDTDDLVSQFRGIASMQSAARKRFTKGVPMSAAKIGESALKAIDFGRGGPREALIQNWDAIIPQNYAPLCVPLTIRAGVLTIRADSAVLKQQLLFEHHGILKRIQAYPACASIKKLRII